MKLWVVAYICIYLLLSRPVCSGGDDITVVPYRRLAYGIAGWLARWALPYYANILAIIQTGLLCSPAYV